MKPPAWHPPINWGRMGEAVVPALIDTFQHDNEAVRRNASYALSTIGAAAVPALVDTPAKTRTREREAWRWRPWPTSAFSVMKSCRP